MTGLSLLDRRLSARFDLRVVIVPPGGSRRYRPAEWEDSLVVVEWGEIDLDALDGSRTRFVAGDSLWFCGLGLRRLTNRGDDPAVLAAVSRASTVARCASS